MLETAKYAAKFQKSVDAIAIHIQREYKGGPDIAKVIRDLVLPSINLPTFSNGTSSTRERSIYGNRSSPRQTNASFSLRSIRSRHTHLCLGSVRAS
jgi:hypothetical protein